MNKKLVVFSLVILVSMSFVYAFSFKDVLSGRVSLFDIISGRAAINTTCIDSDGGINYNITGNVSVRGMKNVYKDACSGTSGRLIERYCKSNKVATKVYKCPNGCSNGACKTTSSNQSSNSTR